MASWSISSIYVYFISKCSISAFFFVPDMKTHESYALGSAVAIDGYMVIEEEPAVLDAQIGFIVEDLKRDGLFYGVSRFKKR
nr:hypothetical protein [Tanacetum cinerariifolium]